MPYIAYCALLIYSLALLHTALYCGVAFHLLVCYLRPRATAPLANLPITAANLPTVTIQLPLYNEQYVAARLIDAVAALVYPPERLCIRVLDDSTDQTIDIVRERVAHYAVQGLTMVHSRRTNRTGFKAGALAAGLAQTTTELVAIFDADFVPSPDFLLQTVPYFAQSPQLGMLQTRWQHLNQNHSWLTRLQALQLNVHFTVEQAGRAAGGYAIQFNGTAGLWRKAAIIDAGGWQADTLTEDLDLSYRAQLAGWQMQYIETIGTPAELPTTVWGLQSQQFRWTKGGAECGRKLLGAVWRSRWQLGRKLHATAHLTSSWLYVSMQALLWSSIALAVASRWLPFSLHYLAVFFSTTLLLGLVHGVANIVPRRHWKHLNRAQIGRKLGYFLVNYPLLLAMSMAFSFRNSIAVWEGWRGRKSPFERTPKYGNKHLPIYATQAAYTPPKLAWQTIAEGIIAVVLTAATCYDVVSGQLVWAVFHAGWAAGYFVLVCATLRERK